MFVLKINGVFRGSYLNKKEFKHPEILSKSVDKLFSEAEEKGESIIKIGSTTIALTAL